MNKFKSGLLFFISLFVVGALKAQTLEDGKKFMYYERYKSARTVFEKLVAANPNDADAVYWLGQSMLNSDPQDLAGAKALYQKTLMNNSNSALLLAGMGHVELLEGKTQDARNRFETAVSLSQGKNKDVLNAIGVANIQAEKGDAEYAVAKLKQATELKKMADPDVWANLGDAYKKLTQGGPAQSAYEAALGLNPNYARSSYRIGKIYQTQGRSQEELYLRYYDEAMTKDPAYAPVYENLYQYYYLTNVGKSAEYLEKFLANTDADPQKDCYYRTSMKYAQGLFAEAVSTGNQCITAAGASGPYPNIYGVLAYAYDRLGDSLNAKSSFEKYFEKQSPEKIGPTDYAKYAEVLLKIPGNEETAITYVNKAVAADSTEKGKADLLKSIASKFEAQKNFKEAGEWYGKILTIKKNPSKTDLYNAGYNLFRAGDYAGSINVFNIYSQSFPDDPFGYYMCGKNNWAIDSTLAQGLANDCFNKAIEAGVKDTVKYKPQLIGSYKYFVVYNVYKKDKAAALGFIDRILWLDPADAETLANRDILNKPAGAAPKSKTGGSGAKTSGTKR